MKMPNVTQKPILPVVAMADIAFLLLVFFIVTSALDQNRKLKIDVPVTKNTVTIPQEQVFAVYIDQKAEMVFKGRSVTLSELDFQFMKHRSVFKDPILQIVADARVEYAKVDAVVQTLRKKMPVRVAFICREDKE